MNDRKTVIYVSPTSNYTATRSACANLPINLKKVNSIEELYQLFSDPFFQIDFVCISIHMFYERADKLDMFDIVHTLTTLIRSTVYRSASNTQPKQRDTKIAVLADETVNIDLLKQVKQFPDICTIGWIVRNPEDVDYATRHLKRVLCGDYTPHPKVLELLKPKKNANSKQNSIVLTVRQDQILKLIRERGASNKIIAKMLGISESTVKLHVGAILKKYCVRNRTQLAVFSKEKNASVGSDS